MSSAFFRRPPGATIGGYGRYNNHGLGVAAIAAARGDNNEGIAGVCWRCRLNLINNTIEHSGVEWDGWWTSVDGIARLALSGARAINLSSEPAAPPAGMEVSASVAMTVDVLKFLASPDINKLPLIVFPAGNDHGNDVDFGFFGLVKSGLSSLANHVIIVAASNIQAHLASYSNVGSLVDIAAPGGEFPSGGIYTARMNGNHCEAGQDTGLHCQDLLRFDGQLPDNDPIDNYGYGSGTSLAAPFVTGLAGLLWSKDNTLSVPQVKDFILDGARDEGRGKRIPGQQFYIINACKSLVLLTKGNDNCQQPIGVGPLFWTDRVNDKIQSSSLDGGDIRDIVTRADTQIDVPSGIAVDPIGGKIYWVDGGLARIYRSSLDGSAIEIVVDGIQGTVQDIAVNASEGKIYWILTNVGKIYKADLDGLNKNVEEIITMNPPFGSGVRYIGLDSVNGKIYWSFLNIFRANLDGSSIEQIPHNETVYAYDIAIDAVNGKIYWSSNIGFEPNGKIRRSNLNGTNIEDVVTGVRDVIGIALDLPAGKIYWGDDKKIQRADLDGLNKNVEEIVPSGVSIPQFVALSLP